MKEGKRIQEGSAHYRAGKISVSCFLCLWAEIALWCRKKHSWPDFKGLALCVSFRVPLPTGSLEPPGAPWFAGEDYQGRGQGIMMCGMLSPGHGQYWCKGHRLLEHDQLGHSTASLGCQKMSVFHPDPYSLPIAGWRR